jgi:hypothetical protein
MTQKTAFSSLMLNGKQLTIKDAEEIASEVMEHATRRSLKCKWDKCGLHYGSIHLLGRVSGLENVSCASAHWVKSISDKNIFPSWLERSWGPQRLEPYVNATPILLTSCDFPQITRVPRNLQCGFKQCATKTDTVYSTTSDLLNHIQLQAFGGYKMGLL